MNMPSTISWTAHGSIWTQCLSRSQVEAVTRLLSEFPKALWVQHDPGFVGAEVTRKAFGGPKNVTYDFTSTVTGTTRRYTTTASLVDEIQIARIAGGMHFRSATVDGAALGKSVANWVLARAFQPR